MKRTSEDLKISFGESSSEPKINKMCIDLRCPEMRYFMNESESDITFIVEGQRIPAKKWLLAFKSEVFEAMFSGNFKESTVKEIEIKDTNAEAFKQMMYFIYFDKLDTRTPINGYLMAIDVYKLGHRYQLYRLMDCIEEQLLKSITMNTIEEIYQMAAICESKKLIKALREFIDENIYSFLRISYEQMNRINSSTNNYLIGRIVYNTLKMRAEREIVEKFFDGTKKEVMISGINYTRNAGIKCFTVRSELSEANV